MMWKLWNKLFKWDYVYWAGHYSRGISRVMVDGLGRPYYWRGELGDRRVHVITGTTDNVLWLTCPPTNYLKKKM
jgi:hypothetical protein